MTHLEALNTLIQYYEGGASVSGCRWELENCKKNQQKRPYSLPKRPSPINPAVLFTPLLIVAILGVITLVVFGITGLLSHYFLFGYTQYPAMKVGYFIMSWFGGESASVVTVDFVRAWADNLGWTGFFGILIGYVGAGLGIGIAIHLIMMLWYPGEVKAWKMRCAELTPERFEAEENERIEKEKNRQPELESRLSWAMANEGNVNNIISQLHIPSQYLNEKSLKILRGYILSGRAYTVADAINQAIADQWRSNQEAINQEAADNAEQARKYAEKTHDEIYNYLHK